MLWVWVGGHGGGGIFYILVLPHHLRSISRDGKIMGEVGKWQQRQMYTHTAAGGQSQCCPNNHNTAQLTTTRCVTFRVAMPAVPMVTTTGRRRYFLHRL